MNLPLIIFFIIIPAIIFFAVKLAKIYTIPVSDFKNLFIGMTDEQLQDITTIGPNDVKFNYKIYPIDSIQCYDKKDNQAILKNSPGLEIQFTDTDNKKTSIYFDTIRIRGTLITGSPSRYFSSIPKTIDLNKIQKIEVRNVKKGFRYSKKQYV